MEARVYKSTGSWYTVKAVDKFFQARLKGIFKIDALASTNPIAVGDNVEIEMENEVENTVTITNILERSNYIVRISPHNKNQHHIVASNIDQSLLFATLKDPKTSQGFIDRFLITAEAYHIPAIIVFNKLDIYREKEMNKFYELKNIYEQIGYKVIGVSIVKNEGVEELKKMLQNKTTLLSGHSGVGKSSFINTIFPGFQLRIQEVSGWSGKGMHTTTFAEMFSLPFGGYLIDTPGIQEWGIIDIDKQELGHFFPEIRQQLSGCKFHNCRHIREPGCAVLKALEHGDIAESRYESYLSIYHGNETRG